MRFAKRLSFVMLVCFVNHAQAEVVKIGTTELARLQSQGVPVVDIRGADEWKATGVIPGAHLITVSSYFGNAAASWQAKLAQTAGPNQPVILVCQTGVRSAIAARYLSWMKDYALVYDAKGGMSEWAAEKRPVVAPGAGTVN